jgi:predicted phage terminase large subunit-like protein
MAHQLERVIGGDVKRLLITMPPRSLKSITVSVALPAYVLGHDPTKRIVCVSYAEDLAERHARDCRAVMQAVWFRRLFPHTRLSRQKSAELDFETTRRGGRLSTSVGGTLTGRGGSLIVIDDPQKPTDAMSVAKRATALDWLRNTVMSRLDDQRHDAIVVVTQRLHVDDIVGHLIETGSWTHLNLPAIAVNNEVVELGGGLVHHRRAGEPLHAERMPLDELEKLKESMGTFHFSAQYQQEPIPEAGYLVKSQWFQTYLSAPSPDAPGRIVQSWDFAVKDGEHNDWTVCLTAHVLGNIVHVLDVYRDKIDYPTQRKSVVSLACQHGASVVLIEAAANGGPLIADLRDIGAQGVPTPIAVWPRGSKIERLAIQSHRIEAGEVKLPERALWLDAFRAEIAAFPNGRHDDQVDALSQLLTWVDRDTYLGTVSTVGPKFLVDGEWRS